ncbi:MAG: MoaD/ThiS family protein [Candidatus Verstraetearchaeota archaeon]|nr:MoaD/ThiS family protein [Candidatus Verstraetearchaeota archaeon]
MKITFLFFASVRELVGRSKITLDLPDDLQLIDALILLTERLNISIKNFLVNNDGSLRENLRLALNLKIISPSDLEKLFLKDGDVVAIFPTPSGG